jgi:hypothetical protein
MPDFTALTAAESLAALERLPRRRARAAMRDLIYRKSSRPRALPEQLALLQALARAPQLDRFAQSYALIACAHKASELVDRPMLAAIDADLQAAFDWAADLPQRNVLRMDGFHLRYSLLNVLIGSALLRGDDAALAPLTARALDTLDGLAPRRASSYLFNSSSNVVKTVCLAVAFAPERAAPVHQQLRRLISLSLSLVHLHQMAEPLVRRFGLRRLDAVKPASAYTEFEATMKRLFLLEELAASPGDPALCRRLARASMARRTEAQEAAMAAALERHLPAPGGAVADTDEA